LATAEQVSPAAALGRSTLAAAGGVAVVELLDRPHLRALQAEANRAHPQATEHRQDLPPVDRWDRGNPDRWLLSAPGGPVMAALLASDRLTAVLDRWTGIAWKPLSPQGSFSFYDRPGHHLGLHRDIQSCDLTCIINCGLAGDGSGSELIVYPASVKTPLDQVRAGVETGELDGRTITMEPGQAALIFGGLIPHRVTPVVGRLQRTVAPICFTPARPR
jgi:hypothetical protein